MAAEDGILRAQFIEAYAARRVDQSMRSIAQRLEIPEPDLRRWLRDPAFRDSLKNEDVGRLEMAREICSRHITTVAENQARIAESDRSGTQRAALWIARGAGFDIDRPRVTVNNNAAMPSARDVAQIMREMEEVDRLLAAHREKAKVETED